LSGTTPAGHPHPTPSEEKASTHTLGQLITEVTKDFSTLMRQEIALAKAEVTDSAKKAGTGAGLLGGAGYAATTVILFLSISLAWALGDALDSVALGALIVAIIWAIIAAVLFFVGRAQLKKVQGLPKTTESVKQIPETLKRNEENR